MQIIITLIPNPSNRHVKSRKGLLPQGIHFNDMNIETILFSDLFFINYLHIKIAVLNDIIFLITGEKPCTEPLQQKTH
jgi:hypothetical protein